MNKRLSGLLLHISSFPSPYGIGDFGPQAYHTIDILHKLKMTYWQILPLTPTEAVYGNSPYSSPSAFAGNTLFISPELLCRDGLLTKKDLQGIPKFSEGEVDYEAVGFSKSKIFRVAFENFKKTKRLQKDYAQFLLERKDWLLDYALFVVLKNEFDGKPWNEWPQAFKTRNSKDLQRIQNQRKDKIDYIQFLQFVFDRQWKKLHEYCKKRHVHIIGDIPIYVSFDSADIWAYPQFYKLDQELNPQFVAGVPPDYFSETGQRWGNPVYDWKALKTDRYGWWKKRLWHSLKLFDCVRIDHFRGFAAYWEIPVYEQTAVKGYWVEAPGKDFFKVLKQELGELPIITEDLGYITEDVKELKRFFNFPGMKILLFAFGGNMDENPYIPEKFEENCIVYTGTHDNNTVVGWFENNATEEEKANLAEYLGREPEREGIHWKFIEMAIKSKAKIAIIPLQDLLGLDEVARMNKPSTTHGNWRWRAKPADFKSIPYKQWNDLVKLSRRIF